MSAVCIDCGASVDPQGTQQREGRERRAVLVSCLPDRCLPDRASEGTQSRVNAIACQYDCVSIRLSVKSAIDSLPSIR